MRNTYAGAGLACDMETHSLSVEYEGDEFTFTVEQHDDVAQIHLYVKEVWWGVPTEAGVNGYIDALEHYAKRLEALVANGWELSHSDGEHLYFVNESLESLGENPHKVTDQLE